MKNLILIFIWLLGNAHSQTLAASAAIGITGNSVGLIRVGMEAEKILNFTKPISDKLETMDEGELIRVMRLNQNGISLGLFFDKNKVRSAGIVSCWVWSQIWILTIRLLMKIHLKDGLFKC